MAFHDRLKQARLAAGYTQSEVANFLGIAKSTYSGYETGRSEPSMCSIANMMQFFNVSPEFLWQDEMEHQFKNNYPERYKPLPDMYAQSRDEEELLTAYRSLIPSARETVLTTVRAFSGNPAMQKEEQQASAI